MQFIYKDVKVNYSFYDNDANTSLIYLHGWGQNIEMMMPIAKPFIKKLNVLIVDLPGFGLSDEPKDVWDIYEYAKLIESLRKELKLKKVILIGHSFGGKIALTYATMYNPEKIVLLASPYKKNIQKDSLKLKVLKSFKKIPVLNKLENYVKKHIGSTDYKNASEVMRKILVKHVNLDMSEEAKKIKCPTLLIWGTCDQAVDYEDALELEKIISNCGLVTYEGCTHYAYLERLDQTICVLKKFIGSEKK